ncbi:MAG: lytic transglycosylase domain-containing protein [Clostridia bacterium]
MGKKIVWTITYFVLLLLCFCSIVFLCFSLKYPLKYHDIIASQSEKFSFSPELIASVINCESSFNKDAKSAVGAVGLMQIMPSTGQWVALKMSKPFSVEMLFDAEKNVEIGCFYLKYLLEKFKNLPTCLAAYNAGEGVVKKWIDTNKFLFDGKDFVSCPYSETTKYVHNVLSSLKFYEKRF